jgi:putative oxidoreductase
MAIFSKLGHYSSMGILVMRIGLGAMMITHGYPKLMGGPELWGKIGLSMGNMGVHSYATFWGFMAAFAEGIGGLFVLLGLFFRPACILITFTMIVAAAHHIHAGDGLKGAGHAIELAFAYFGLIFIGPGKYSVDKG